MSPLTVGLDVDNVLYPFSEVMTRWAERYAGLRPGSLDDVAHTWTWYRDQWGWTGEDFLDAFEAGVLANVVFTEGDPSPGALHAAVQLHDAGHRIEYVSDRQLPHVDAVTAEFKTRHWLRRHGFPQWEHVTITPDKASVRTDVFLDDKPENYDQLLVAGHRHPLLWTRPHNRLAREDRVRIDNWSMFRRYVDQVSGIRVAA